MTLNCAPRLPATVVEKGPSATACLLETSGVVGQTSVGGLNCSDPPSVLSEEAKKPSLAEDSNNNNNQYNNA